ncbi:MAG: tRNA pseudouridine(55) synthase TruB [Gammaproteobacteria bacterium]|nr:tRNA pseudouridine(55) synthase TruB [Gammaproteobacteria bacterium]
MSRRRKHGRHLHGILLLDKATGCSSNHALQQVKRLFDARKAGHTGSLDPLATGMLPVCFGEATKLSHYLLEADKSYLTGARLGRTTTTADAEGEILQERAIPSSLDLDQLQQIASRFQGEIDQVPPMYSALKVDGQRLYRLAREGKTVERKPRRVTIHAIRVLHLEDGLAAIEVQCSKGTYIRSLVEDIGEALGCGAHVESLHRTSVSPFEGEPMHSFASLEAQVAGGSADALLLPPDAMLTHLPRSVLPPAMAGLFVHGQAVPADASIAAGVGDCEVSQVVRVYGPDGLLGIGEQIGERLKPQRILNYSAVS